MAKVERRHDHRLLLLLACALAIGVPCRLRADSAVEKILLAKAQSLVAHGYLDLAVQTWQQVLLSDPANREALLGIAKADMQLGKTDESKQYVERLRALGDTKDLAQIENMPHVQPQSVRLKEASRLAEQGQYAGAMRIYRDIYGDEPPPGDVARAYYDTEAALPESRSHAIDGLRKLSNQFPADSQYAITLGRILTYDPKTRAEGIALLNRYGSSAAAQKALQQAAAWSGEGMKSATGVSPATPAPTRGTPQSPLEGSAYRALNRDNLDEAERQFQALLAKQPQNPQALSGMGYVYMKRRDFAQAMDSFKRARAQGAKGLEEVIATASFWQAMAQAGDLLKSGDTQAAVDQYHRALSLKPASPDAQEALVGALLQAGEAAEAVEILKREVRAASAREAAWRNLFLAESAMGDAQSALATSQAMPKHVRADLESDPEYLRSLAQDNLALGQKSEAGHVLEHALTLPFPNHGRDLPVEKQLQFAALLMMAKRYEPAIELYSQALAEDGENAGAWRALAGAEHQLGRDDAAIATISRMPQGVYDQSQNDSGFLQLLGSIYQSRNELDRAQKSLEKALSVAGGQPPGIELQLAGVYVAQGDLPRAYTIYRRETGQNPNNSDAWRGLIATMHAAKQDQDALRELSSMPELVRFRLEQDPSYLQTLASIESANGRDKDALRIFRQIAQLYLDQRAQEPVDVQIQYGWLLLKAGDDGRLYSVVSSLANSPGMTDEQHAEFNQMWAAWSVRRANSALAAGDQRRAVAILETAAQAFPKNTSVYGALAAAYLQVGQPKRAVAVYSLLDMLHADPGQIRGAIGAALAARDMKQAESWLEIALDRYKNDPAILKMAAQYEEARGNRGRAAAYYRAALDAMGAESPREMFSYAAGSGDAADAQNGASPSRDLMQLLAPSGSAAPIKDDLDREESGRDSAPPLQDGAPGTRVSTLGDFAQPAGDVPSYSAPEDAGSGSFRDPEVRPATAERDLATPAEFGELGRAGDAARKKPACWQERPQARASALDDFAEPRNDIPRDVVPVSAPGQPGSGLYHQVRQADMEGSSNAAANLRQAVSEMDSQPEASQKLNPADLPHLHLNDPPAGQAFRASSPVLPPLTGSIVSGAAGPKTQRQQVKQQLAVIEGSSSAWTGGTSSLDYRSGQPGYDRLSMYSAQAEGSAMIGPQVRATVIVKPVLLDAGQATGTETIQQGTLPLNSVPYVQTAAGVGGEFQLQTSNFAARLGYTPSGFLVEHVIGGLYIHPPAGHFTLEFSRDPILDTQLSFAGLRDEGSASSTYVGNVWGGVISNSGELQVNDGDSRAGWYLQGGGQYVTGLHVPDNKRIDGDGGAYWAAWKSGYGSLTAGMNFFGMHYQRNLRYFTYGQGGYFSPGAYLLAAVPLTFNGSYGERFHYRAMGSLGLQAFQEDSAPYFPLDPSIQAAQGNPSYPERTSVGGNYNLETEGSYAIAEHWYVGGFMAFNNSRDYASDKVGFYLRFVVRPQPTGAEGGPVGLFPVQGLRPLQVP